MPKNKSKAAAREERRIALARQKIERNRRLVARVQQEMTTEAKPARRESLKPLNDAQRAYDAAIRSRDIVFGLGPAGTGKTWYAVMMAAEALSGGEIEKIYITRPNVEVGVGFGFLPGDLDEKYAPYLLPLEDVFVEAFGRSHYEYLVKARRIDARPLAFMRGTTLKNGWVIADEMQNATKAEFKMLLSRIGENCKMIINGDPRQCDFPDRSKSGLIDAVDRLKDHPRIGVVRFGREHVVRSGLCQDVIEAYED